MFGPMPSTRDQRPYNVKYYARNRAKEIERVMSRQRATLEFLRELRRVPCKDCGGRFEPHQMDFDHRDPKTKLFGLTWPKALLAPRQRLLDEIAKCDIVCANCHSIRTYGLQQERKAARRAAGTLVNSRRRIRQRAIQEPAGRALLIALRDRPCLDCNQRFPPFVMQFDHRDPTQKKFLVSGTWLSAPARVLKEAAKCDIVCANCHRDRTFKRRLAGVAQLARATAFQAVGRGFETRLPLRYGDQDIEQLRLLEPIGRYAA